jgi:hypothetical protein
MKVTGVVMSGTSALAHARVRVTGSVTVTRRLTGPIGAIRPEQMEVPLPSVVVLTDAAGSFSVTIDDTAALTTSNPTVPGLKAPEVRPLNVTYYAKAEYLAADGHPIMQATASSSGSEFEFSLRLRPKKVVIVDIDGLRWDVFQKHLKQVRAAGASLSRTYIFAPPKDVSSPVSDGRPAQLYSALGYLCFGSRCGFVDVRMARSSYPTITYSAHSVMYTGMWPNATGITGNKFMNRAGGAWQGHDWESPPRVIAMGGWCTGADSREGVLSDYAWGGFSDLSDGKCSAFSRGLVSDLKVHSLFDFARDRGLRATAIHTQLHGALQPWSDDGKDSWWHPSQQEGRSLVDISIHDIPFLSDVAHSVAGAEEPKPRQAEVYDSSALAKLHFVLKGYLPHGIRSGVDTYDELVHRDSGKFRRDDWTTIAEVRHAEGAPRLASVYLLSVDESSHAIGTKYQEAYLAWFDHRLATILRDLQSSGDLDDTAFVFVADHGEDDLVVDESLKATYAKEETWPNSEGAYRKILEACGENSAAWQVWGQSMNMYFYAKDPSRDHLLSMACKLLAGPAPLSPVGALVRDGDAYRFLAPGDAQPVDIASDRCRQVLDGVLDLPPASDDVKAVTLDSEAFTREQEWRDRLAKDPLTVLRIPERAAGLGPRGGTNGDRSPDIVLLAPEHSSFGYGRCTHGSFAYPTTRIPMVFCGPGIGARAEIPEADLIDLTPSVLSLLDIDPAPYRLDGHALVDRTGRPLRPVIPADVFKNLPSLHPVMRSKLA